MWAALASVRPNGPVEIFTSLPCQIIDRYPLHLLLVHDQVLALH